MWIKLCRKCKFSLNKALTSSIISLAIFKLSKDDRVLWCEVTSERVTRLEAAEDTETFRLIQFALQDWKAEMRTKTFQVITVKRWSNEGNNPTNTEHIITWNKALVTTNTAPPLSCLHRWMYGLKLKQVVWAFMYDFYWHLFIIQNKFQLFMKHFVYCRVSY